MKPPKVTPPIACLTDEDRSKKPLKQLAASIERYTTLQNRKVMMFVRNAERVDRVFPEWIHQNFTDTGEYYPDDLNLPPRIFTRPEGPGGYIDDSPITEIGALNSEMIGKALRRHEVWPLTSIICSPSLRCVQTASAIIKGIHRPAEICIEPGLFDWCHWYKAMPSLLSVEELIRCGYPVSANYAPVKPLSEVISFAGHESIEHFYERVRSVVEHLTGVSDRILIVAHATVLDASLKALRRCSPRLITENDMLHMGSHYPYACEVTLALNQGAWNFVHEPFAPLSYLGVSNRVNAKFVNRTTKPKTATHEKQKEVKKPTANA
ncbi:hypothetical protein QR680_008135 [Steinernema hermaphroditum]|uniref:Protein UBASH3A-like protein n=1 Tax=Steinernema hermaphroditum TaxID=289476 RepID=A0AA39IGY3_9BILA|nr:hypothetical protein QR680_008135 [Steinernema hermaphroditum]